MERLKKYICLIMSICVILTLFGCTAVPTDATQPSTETTQEDVVQEWTPIYHKHQHGINANFAWPAGSYQVELTQEQIHILLPDKVLKDISGSGWVRFLENGQVYMVALSIARQTQVVSVYYNDVDRMFSCCISLEDNAPVSVCGELEYKIYHINPYENRPGMIAETVINGMLIRVTNEADDFDEEKPFFEEVLEWLSWYGSNKPDLSVLKPSKE